MKKIKARHQVVEVVKMSSYDYNTLPGQNLARSGLAWPDDPFKRCPKRLLNDFISRLGEHPYPTMGMALLTAPPSS